MLTFHYFLILLYIFSDYRHQNGFSTNEIGYERAIHMDDEIDDPQDVQSDIDSQVCGAENYH